MHEQRFQNSARNEREATITKEEKNEIKSYGIFVSEKKLWYNTGYSQYCTVYRETQTLFVCAVQEIHRIILSRCDCLCVRVCECGWRYTITRKSYTYREKITAYCRKMLLIQKSSAINSHKHKHTHILPVQPKKLNFTLSWIWACVCVRVCVRT